VEGNEGVAEDSNHQRPTPGDAPGARFQVRTPVGGGCVFHRSLGSGIERGKGFTEGHEGNEGRLGETTLPRRPNAG
jgi:hypothetical protein